MLLQQGNVRFTITTNAFKPIVECIDEDKFFDFDTATPGLHIYFDFRDRILEKFKMKTLESEKSDS